MSETWRALTLYEPLATLAAMGLKTIETRSRDIKYRGMLAIHASKNRIWTRNGQANVFLETAGIRWRFPEDHAWPYGMLIGICRVVDSWSTNSHPPPGNPDFALGDYLPNRYGIELQGAWKLAWPVPCKGALGLWKIPEDVLSEVLDQFA